MKMKFVALIGNHSFYDEFQKIKKDLEADGGTRVFIPDIFDISDPQKLTMKDEVNLEELYQSKMRMSDYVLVVNKNGFIGKDTLDKIDWCKWNQIPVKYLNPEFVTLRRTIGIWDANERNPNQKIIKVIDPVTDVKSSLEFRNRLTVSTKEYVEFWVKEYLRSQDKLASAMLDNVNTNVNIELEGIE